MIYDTWHDMLWYMIYMTRYVIYDIWYDIWYDITWYDTIHDMTCYDMLWYDLIYMTRYIMWYMIYYIWYDTWHDMIRYDMIYDMIYDIVYMIYLTAIGFTPSGSSTVYIHTQTIHRTQSTQTIHRTQSTQTIHRTQSTQTIRRTTQSTQTIHRTIQTIHCSSLRQYLLLSHGSAVLHTALRGMLWPWWRHSTWQQLRDSMGYTTCMGVKKMRAPFTLAHHTWVLTMVVQILMPMNE
jgi:hypothetical protein